MHLSWNRRQSGPRHGAAAHYSQLATTWRTPYYRAQDSYYYHYHYQYTNGDASSGKPRRLCVPMVPGARRALPLAGPVTNTRAAAEPPRQRSRHAPHCPVPPSPVPGMDGTPRPRQRKGQQPRSARTCGSRASRARNCSSMGLGYPWQLRFFLGSSAGRCLSRSFCLRGLSHMSQPLCAFSTVRVQHCAQCCLRALSLSLSSLRLRLRLSVCSLGLFARVVRATSMSARYVHAASAHMSCGRLCVCVLWPLYVPVACTTHSGATFLSVTTSEALPLATASAILHTKCHCCVSEKRR